MPILDFESALDLIARRNTTSPATEGVPLPEALHRVLATDIHADRDQPPFDRATRDGFAIQTEALPGPFEIVGKLRAGELWQGPELARGQAVQIMTGAPIPAGADAVLMVEHATIAENTLTTERTLDPGENIVPRGAEARLGQAVVLAGTRITPSEIALAATCGCARLEVFRWPRVAIIATGDELVEVTETPNAQQIRNSNSYAIAALVGEAGGEPMRLAIAPDTREAIRERLREALSADLIVFSGGVSMGEYDLVEAVLDESAEFQCTGVRMQPGKPVVFGSVSGKPFFGLPGNPISTEVTFRCFVSPLLRALGGEAGPAPRWAQATLAEDIPARPNITRLLPARLEGTSVRLIPWQGSGDLAANARANCYAELLPDHAYATGNIIRILLR